MTDRRTVIAALRRCLILILPLFLVDAMSSAVFAKKATKSAFLSGGQANVQTPAYGSARIHVDTDTNTLRYHIAYGALTSPETAAHIHGPAGPGMTAGVKHGLPPGSPKTGEWVYDEADEADILAGKMYINIHTSQNPGGEIRGQIVDLVARIDGAQSGTGSTGRGYGLFNIDVCQDVFDYYIEFEGLQGTETAAHIHGLALHGQNAGVKHPLPAGSPKVGFYAYDGIDRLAILDGQMYVNIHSDLFPGGEIRGQITPIVAPIDGAQVVPAVTTPGHGTGMFAIDRGTDRLSYLISFADLTAPETAAHIHGYAPPGQNAGVKHPLVLGSPKLGTWMYPAAEERMIVDGLTYVNIHSGANPGGEIRGQVVLPEPNQPCVGDTNCDDTVDVLDLLDLLANWGPYTPCPPYLRADTNRDCVVDVLDLLNLLANWGPC